MSKALSKEIVQNAAEAGIIKAGTSLSVLNNDDDASIKEQMAESVVIAAAWFTVRMICQVSYKAIKSYREAKHENKALPEPNRGFSAAFGGDSSRSSEAGTAGTASVSASASASASASWSRSGSTVEPRAEAVADSSGVPWAPVTVPVQSFRSAQASGEASAALENDDREWVEELRRAANSRTRDNLRLLGEIQMVSKKVDNIPLEALYDKLKHAMKLLLEYQQNPGYRTSQETLQQAEMAAREVYNNERSLVMNLSALRIRIVITYLHCPKHSRGLEPSMDDKEADKQQCEFYVSNALKQGALNLLCRTFLASRDSPDKQLREQVERDTMIAFDIILEVISSVYLLEPFRPSQGPLPKDAPDIVIHALSTYCESGLGNSHIYLDLAQALRDWQSTPERQEKWALHCLYKSTNGPAWACSEGWDSLFEGDLSSLYGVSTKGGHVTKISLGANNLEGKLPPQLDKLTHLEELALPGNNIFGRVPAKLWELPCLKVVALQGNGITRSPPTTFTPAACVAASTGGAVQEPSRRRLGIAGTVEACHPGKLIVHSGEWFMCSWKISNTGGVAFGKGTKLSRAGDDKSVLGGAEDVPVNPLDPGEEQTVCVMQQAPNYEAWCEDEWALVGEGLDFVSEAEAKSKSPYVTVSPRAVGGRGSKGAEDDANRPSLANSVFVASGRHRRGSSQYSSHNQSLSQYFQHSAYGSSHHTPF